MKLDTNCNKEKYEVNMDIIYEVSKFNNRQWFNLIHNHHYILLVLYKFIITAFLFCFYVHTIFVFLLFDQQTHSHMYILPKRRDHPSI